MDSLLKSLGGAGNGGVSSNGSSAADRQAEGFRQNVNGLLSRGIHTLTPGTLEKLNPSELGLLQGAARESGWDWNDIMRQYSNAGVGQGSASAA
jgi:hypothetical protein